MKCNGCKNYFKGEDVIRVGMVCFCSEKCMEDTWNNKKVYDAPKPGKPLKRGAAPTRSTPKKRSSSPTRRRARSGVLGAVRSAVFEADGNRCRFCGRESDSLSIHHVRYRSEMSAEVNGVSFMHERQNLLTLCSACHTRVHSDKERYQRLALGILWLREVLSDKTTHIPQLERWLRKTNNR